MKLSPCIAMLLFLLLGQSSSLQANEMPIYCGNYSENITIKAGKNLITCNTNFLGKVVIEAGAQILADDFFNISFKSGITAKGTQKSPIVFSQSDNSLSEKWKRITIKSNPNEVLKYNLKSGHIEGNLIEHVTFKKTQNINLKGVYVTNSQFNVLKKIQLGNIFVKQSLIKAETLEIFNSSDDYEESRDLKSYLVSSIIRPSSSSKTTVLAASHTIFAYNTFDSIKFYYELDYNSFVFNTFKKIDSSVNGNSHFHGNIIKKGIEHLENQNKKYNHTYRVKNNLAVIVPISSPKNKLTFPENKISYNVKTQNQLSFTFLTILKDRFDLDTELTTKAFYHENGVPYEYKKTWKGSSLDFSFDRVEAYNLTFALKNRPELLVISPRIRIDVE